MATAVDLSVTRFLLDSNIVSELIRSRPRELVMRRYKAHQGQMALPTPALHEVHYGCLRLPMGEKRDRLQSFLNQVVGLLPKVPYDAAAALLHAQFRAELEGRGRVLPQVDAQIAAIAIAHGLTLVTRNTRDFEGLPGLRLANWFED